ncbi:iron complex transport system substrate-binding protein [Actinoalloteichus hoggarensis]|uniref:Putative siderophore-binding lipoprotein YfiY n=1 Tax=Actinoalloteichus hoggarensis TaxID=1470176 RepID=A0A221W6A9_9PSEU|nr:iron-siderophore ABC transporter substrate-binding protein [Actinoalloteichus hoggarensis]ASO21264.1 putative siderophore-binding lipoprotein YfiY precursor [Actinoalloteichus hoggarensis]MBB5921196.1 iron complex transport system substrate-binding protein [Actinoalloteichus hoggarensis]
MSSAVRHRTRGAAVAVPLAICLLLSACGGGEEAQTPAPEGASQEGFPRTISHAMGETTLETRPTRVATLDTSYIDAAMALDLDVVARINYHTADGTLPGYLKEDEQAQAEAATVIGEITAPDVEMLWDVEPELIVSAQVRHEEIYPELSEVAPTVFSETTGATWKDNIRLLGEATGREDLAEERISAYEQRAASIGEAIREELGRDATVTMARFVEGEPTVRLYTSASFPGIILADAGLTRPEGQADSEDEIMVNLSQEEITDLDADRIFVSTYTDPAAEAENPREQFESNPLWGRLTGEITTVDDEVWVTSVSLQGAEQMLDELAAAFGVDDGRS